MATQPFSTSRNPLKRGRDSQLPFPSPQSFLVARGWTPQEVVKQGPAIEDRKFGKLFKFAQSAAFFGRFSLGSSYHSGDLGAPWALAASTTAGGTTWRTSFAPTGGPQPTCWHLNRRASLAIITLTLTLTIAQQFSPIISPPLGYIPINPILCDSSFRRPPSGGPKGTGLERLRTPGAVRGGQRHNPEPQARCPRCA